MFTSILVAVDGSPSSERALAHAVDLARAMNAVLTLITVAPPLPALPPVTGLDPAQLQDDIDRWAAEMLAHAAGEMPDDVIVHTVQRSGHPGSEIVHELETGRYDLVMLGSRDRGAARAGLLGSVNGSIHFHSRVPMLSIPAGHEDAGD